MSTSAKLDQITDFPSLIHYLRDELEWEIPDDAVFNELTFSWTPSEVGLELNEPIEITQLRPLRADQPWGIFFLNFPHAKLPVTVIRRILRGLSKRQRASANAGDKAAWNKDDLLFISAVGEADDRRLSFAHFQDRGKDLPALRVIGWQSDDTVRRLSQVDELLRAKLIWPGRDASPETWRGQWRSAFRERPHEAIRTSKQLAETLAALAKSIRNQIQISLPQEASDGDLKRLFEAVRSNMSRDLSPKGFADTYAQTIAYGLLSARINQVERWQREQTEALKRLKLEDITTGAAGAAMPTTNPFLAELFGRFLEASGHDPGEGLDYDQLGISDVVDLLNELGDGLMAVLLDFDRDRVGEDPVVHLYETFLDAYDKELKKELGVFYTPKSVVRFIVRSVDEVLRTEFGLEDGLADTTTWAEFVAEHPELTIPEGLSGDEPFVTILDPATGTGTFLVEVIDLIHDRLVAKWKNAGLNDKARVEAWNAWVPAHLLPRLYGFELMMAPYAVGHMKLGLKLADTGYRFEGTEIGSDGTERPARARVFLTNAVEGPRAFALDMNWADALAHEAEAANNAKQHARFTVVVGNPPYQGNSANPSKIKNKLTWIGELIQRYFHVDGRPLGERNSKWLNNDYVKFLRLAEHKIQQSDTGVLGLITSHSWLDSPTFRGVRESILSTFPHLSIVDLHGNIKKKEFAGDEGVFDIEEGTNITVGARLPSMERVTARSDLVGTFKAKMGTLDVNSSSTLPATEINPRGSLYLLTIMNSAGGAEFAGFSSVRDVFPVNVLGFQTHRDGFAIEIDRQTFVDRVSALQTTEDLPTFAQKFKLKDNRDWSIAHSQNALKALGSISDNVSLCSYRPFDDRYTLLGYQLMDYPRTELLAHGRDNLFLNASRQTNTIGYRHVLASCLPPESCLVSNGTREGSYAFGLWLAPETNRGRYRANLSPAFIARLAALTSLTFDDGSDASAQTTLGAALDPTPPAKGALPLRHERGDLKTTFGARDVFDWIYAVLHSPAYRERYADLLKSDFARVPLPKDRALFAELIPLGTELVALHLLEPVAGPILAEPSVRFINPGNVEARLDGRKIATRRNAAGRVYLNDGCWFETVPESVWSHWIGGYQPAQKWLKDRAATGGAKAKLGRVLTPEDQLHYRRMIVALGRTAELMVEIDQVISKHGGWPDAFRGMED